MRPFCSPRALVVTQLWFPSRYWDLARELELLPSLLVLARDLLLVGLLVVLLKDTTLKQAHKGH